MGNKCDFKLLVKIKKINPHFTSPLLGVKKIKKKKENPEVNDSHGHPLPKSKGQRHVSEDPGTSQFHYAPTPALNLIKSNNNNFYLLKKRKRKEEKRNRKREEKEKGGGRKRKRKKEGKDKGIESRRPPCLGRPIATFFFFFHQHHHTTTTTSSYLLQNK